MFSLQLKEMCRRELEKAEQDAARNSAIIADYKVVSGIEQDIILKQFDVVFSAHLAMPCK